MVVRLTPRTSPICATDALFLALAEDAQTVMVTADRKLLRALGGTRYASLARPLGGGGNVLRW